MSVTQQEIAVLKATLQTLPKIERLDRCDWWLQNGVIDRPGYVELLDSINSPTLEAE